MLVLALRLIIAMVSSEWSVAFCRSLYYFFLLMSIYDGVYLVLMSVVYLVLLSIYDGLKLVLLTIYDGL